MRRNLKRTEEFLKRKSSEQETETIIDLESSSQEVSRFKCNLCEKYFNTEAGLKIHKGKAHKRSDTTPIDQLRETSEASYLKGTPAKEAPREEQCVCCGGVMSPDHQRAEEEEEEEGSSSDEEEEPIHKCPPMMPCTRQQCKDEITEMMLADSSM